MNSEWKLGRPTEEGHYLLQLRDENGELFFVVAECEDPADEDEPDMELWEVEAGKEMLGERLTFEDVHSHCQIPQVPLPFATFSNTL